MTISLATGVSAGSKFPVLVFFIPDDELINHLTCKAITLCGFKVLHIAADSARHDLLDFFRSSLIS